MPRYSIGMDFGTESARVVIVDVASGRIAGQASHAYRHGVIDSKLPTSGEKLPADYALQHPDDWLESLATACREAMKLAKVPAEEIVGIGVDFTSCTVLPTTSDGTPLCLLDRFKNVALAWPKLWKHHGAKPQADRVNAVARERGETWLARSGGAVNLEWFFPKILETLEGAPKVYQAAEVWIEAGDWIVWKLTGELVRSTCQAGYKAMWNRASGFPSPAFFKAVHPGLENVVEEKVTGRMLSPGLKAGALQEGIARELGLRAGIAVSAAIIDAHSGVPGAGVASPSTMVMVLGTSSCHMMNSRIEQLAAGISGVVEDGILPGYFGYETGQSSVGDAFAWFVDTFKLSHEALSREAAELPPGSGGVMAIDWLNGCRTPLVDARVSGAFVGLTLSTTPAQMYRALIEATAFGMRWIVDTLREAGVPVRRFVASGGMPLKNPLLMQIYADVLNERIALAESDQAVALGAAILGCLAAGSELTGHASMSQAIHAMARQREDVKYRPDLTARKQYEHLYRLYRSLADGNGTAANVMRQLRELSPGK